MTFKTFCIRGLGAWVFLLAASFASAPMAQAAGSAGTPSFRDPFCNPASPSSRPCRPARTDGSSGPVTPEAIKKIEPIVTEGRPCYLTPEECERIEKDLETRMREYEVRPKDDEPPRTGIIPRDELGPPFPKNYSYENAWYGTIKGEVIAVYAGAKGYDSSDDTVKFDPLTVHGFVIIDSFVTFDKGERAGETTLNKRKQIYTPAAVGSLRIIAAKGNVLTLQSRQGNKFSLNVETEHLTPLGRQ